MDPGVARESDSARRSRSDHTMASPQQTGDNDHPAFGAGKMEPIEPSPGLDALLPEGLDSDPRVSSR